MNFIKNPLKLWRRAHKMFLLDCEDFYGLFNKDVKKLISQIESLSKEGFGVKYVVFTPSGKSGMEWLIKSINPKKEDFLLTQPFQCKENIDLIKKMMNIEYCDVAKNKFNFGVKELKESFNKKIKIIMPVNLYGDASEIADIERFCRKNDIFLLNDCAHLFDYGFNKKSAVSFGDASIVSFSKMHGATCGGLILTNRKDIYEKVVRFRNKSFIYKKSFISDFLQYSINFSMCYLRKFQKIFPIVLIIDKIRELLKKYITKFDYKTGLSKLEIATCLSQLKKTNRIINGYKKANSMFYNLKKADANIRVCESNKELIPLRTIIYLPNVKYKVRDILKYLYKNGCFEPSLNYGQEYEQIIGKNWKNYPNCNKMKDNSIVFSSESLERKDLIEFILLLKKYTKSF